MLNELKYKIEGDSLVNRITGEVVPDDEPVFVLRSKDRKALASLICYMVVLELGSEHRAGVQGAVDAFQRFSAEYPERMKEPD